MTFFLIHGYLSPHSTPDSDDITFSKRGCCVESEEVVRGGLLSPHKDTTLDCLLTVTNGINLNSLIHGFEASQ
jgi:hypothetical protein